MSAPDQPEPPARLAVGERRQVTALLEQARAGDARALDQVLPLVYDELRRLARRHRAGWRPNASVRPPGTVSLVHEAYLRLVDQTQVEWQSRAQFFYLASRAMRSILVDSARHQLRQKRGGGLRQVELEEALLVSEGRAEELVALDEALDKLASRDERLGRVVECRFFGGLSVEETAESLGISPATVKRCWSVARTWLFQELAGASALALAGEPGGGEG
ncbi:MAG TPA: ECF-type sigma factor [Thermoanaerobaculia bacterium]|nr:ECF-type sigma factor [Thermoanaerobaculia bacterium]